MPNQVNPDPLAISLAREAHTRYQPRATFLIGSRARGTHGPRSDIDLLMVTEKKPSPNAVEEMQRELGESSARLYGAPTPVQIIPLTADDWAKEEPYHNNLATTAALDGITAGENQELLQSRYASPNPPVPLYDWTDYKNHLQAALAESKIAVILLHRQGLALDIAAPTSLPPGFVPYPRGITQKNESRAVIRQATAMVQNAVCALVETTGWTARLLRQKSAEMLSDQQDVPQAQREGAGFRLLLEKLESEGVPIPETTIPLRDYGRPSLLQGRPPEAIYRQAVEDCETVKKAATRRKAAMSRAAAKANTASIDPSGQSPEDDPRPIRRFVRDLHRELKKGANGYFRYVDKMTQEEMTRIAACHDHEGWINIITTSLLGDSRITHKPAWLVMLGPEGQTVIQDKRAGKLRWGRTDFSKTHRSRVDRQVRRSIHLVRQALPNPGDHAVDIEGRPPPSQKLT